MNILARRTVRGILVGALVTLGACTSMPDAPEVSNPFDPEAPVDEAPYGLVATIEGGSVILTWPDIADVDTWIVRHSTQTTVFADMDDIGLEQPVDRTGGVARLEHRRPTLESVNYYAVAGIGMVAGRTVPVDMPAVFAPLDGVRNVQTPEVTVEVRTAVATEVELSNASDFTGGQVFAVAAGDTVELAWTLDPAEAAGDTLRVYGRTRSGASTGPTRVVRFVAAFNPAVQPVSGVRQAGNTPAAVDTVVVYEAVGEGIVGLRLKRTVNDVEQVVEIVDPSVPFSLSIPASTTEQVSWTAEIDGALGYSINRNINLRPALEITEPGIELLGGGNTTTTREIQFAMSAAGAGQMIVSEDPSFADATWVAFADTLDFTLSDGVGQKLVYAAFRSPFVEEIPTASVAITYVVPPAATSTRRGR